MKLQNSGNGQQIFNQIKGKHFSSVLGSVKREKLIIPQSQHSKPITNSWHAFDSVGHDLIFSLLLIRSIIKLSEYTGELLVSHVCLPPCQQYNINLIPSLIQFWRLDFFYDLCRMQELNRNSEQKKKIF